jgi:pentatricopeptide repeat domain-containing protein 1
MRTSPRKRSRLEAGLGGLCALLSTAGASAGADVFSNLAPAPKLAGMRVFANGQQQRMLDTTDTAMGFPPYGTQINATIKDLGPGCGPGRGNFTDPQIDGMITLVDHSGSCTMSEKILRAQRGGARAVVIIGTDAETAKTHSIQTVGSTELIDITDGAGVQTASNATDIVIPSVIVTSEDGMWLRSLLYTATQPATLQLTDAYVNFRQKPVVNPFIVLDWRLPAVNKTVQWSLWSSTFDSTTAGYLKSISLDKLARIAASVDSHADFTPHMFVIPGDQWYQEEQLWECQRSFLTQSKTSPCIEQCTNGGRYCLPNPHVVPAKPAPEQLPLLRGSSSKRVTGSMILREDLRQLCVHRAAAAAGKPELWWTYVQQANKVCAEEGGISEACSLETQFAVGIDIAATEKCVESSGGSGAAGDANTLFEEQVHASQASQVMAAPQLEVNGVLYHGRLDCPEPLALGTCGILRFVCAGFSAGAQKPAGCYSAHWKAPDLQVQTYAAVNAGAAGHPRAGDRRKWEMLMVSASVFSTLLIMGVAVATRKLGPKDGGKGKGGGSSGGSSKGGGNSGKGGGSARGGGKGGIGSKGGNGGKGGGGRGKSSGQVEPMQGGSLTARGYTKIIADCAKKGLWEQAVAHLQKLKELGLVADRFHYSAAIDACAHARNWKKGLELLDLMREEGVAPDNVCCNAAISCCEKAKKWKEAAKLLDAMVTGKPGYPKPDTISFSAAISACEKCGQWQKALQLLESMKLQQPSLEPDTTLMNAAISALGQGGQWEQALEMLAGMQESSSKVHADVMTYNAAITACANGKQWQKALALLDTMRSPGTAGIKPDLYSYNSAIAACEKSGEWQKALDVFGRMPAEQVLPDTVTYNSAISACGQAGQWQPAVRLLSQMEERKAKGAHPDTISYNAAISACAKCGKGAEAFKLLDKMRRGGLRLTAVTYTAAIGVCAQTSDCAKATVLLDEAKATHGLKLDAMLYNATISVCEKAGEWRQGITLLSEMEAARIAPTGVTYNAAILGCVKAKQWRHADELYSKAQAESLQIGLPPTVEHSLSTRSANNAPPCIPGPRPA